MERTATQRKNNKPDITPRLSLRGRLARRFPFLHPKTRPSWFALMLHRWFPNVTATVPRIYHDADYISLSRKYTIDFLSEWSGKVRGRVLDVGGGKWTFPRRLFSPSCDYISSDCVSAPNVDVVCDVYELTQTFEPESFDAVLCTSVLEHLPEPKEAIRQIHQLLKPDGIFLLTVPFRYPLHGTDSYKDFWRFTEDGLNLLLSEFRAVSISPNGHSSSPFNYSVVAEK